jgi:hypothetical protein
MSFFYRLSFLEGKGRSADSEGFLLSDMWEWDDEELEKKHDYVQFVFPLMEESVYNPDAPTVTPQLMEMLRQSEVARNNMITSFRRMLRFYGLQVCIQSLCVVTFGVCVHI